jgi:hypothetical protein
LCFPNEEKTIIQERWKEGGGKDLINRGWGLLGADLLDLLGLKTPKEMSHLLEEIFTAGS